MPVTSVTKDPEALTMTLVGDFPVPVVRLWEAFADARQLERFWGPPGYPATFSRHDMTPGGRSEYHMTSPSGDRHHGYWEFIEVDAPRRFEVRDGFSEPDGTPNDAMPTMRMAFEFEATDQGSRFTSVTVFDSAEQFEQLLEMGMEAGATQSMGQLDMLLADLRETALGKGTETEILSDTQVRITRFLDHERDAVWSALTEPDLVRQWLLGPDGWSMPVCEIDLRPGGAYRYRWEPTSGGEDNGFTFEGETLLVEPPHRWVATESMSGVDGPSTTNDVSLVGRDGGTLLTYLITYPNAAARDAALATGMTDGMEASFRRLEEELLSA